MKYAYHHARGLVRVLKASEGNTSTERHQGPGLWASIETLDGERNRSRVRVEALQDASDVIDVREGWPVRVLTRHHEVLTMGHDSSALGVRYKTEAEARAALVA